MTQPWTDFEMVVNYGAEGTYDTVWSYAAAVIKDGSTYKMWYTGYNGTNYRIIYCDSPDGKNWSNHQMVINIGAEGTYDTIHSYAPAVIKDGSTYKMWYSGYNGSWRILYCDSADGKNWSNHQMVVNHGSEGTYDTSISYTAAVIKDGFTYKMWYTGNNGTNQRIIYCDSTDGKNWSNHQMVIDIGAEGTYDTSRSSEPAVIINNSTYKMWYTGNDGTNNRIIYCDSVDGKNWSNHQMVIDVGAEGTYDTEFSFAPTVILDGFTYKMWYTGYNGIYRIIYCDYKAHYISGQFSEDARIIILDESDWSIVANEEKPAGNYVITTTPGKKLVIARKADGQSFSYGNVST